MEQSHQLAVPTCGAKPWGTLSPDLESLCCVTCCIQMWSLLDQLWWEMGLHTLHSICGGAREGTGHSHPASSFGHGCGQFPPWHHHRWNARYGAPFPTITGPAGTTFGCSKSHSRVTPDLETMCPRVWPHRWVQPTDDFVPLVMTPVDGNPCRACQNYHVVKCCRRNHEIAHTDPLGLQILGTFSHRVWPLGHMS